MPDLFYLLSRWWKQVLLLVVLSTLTATIIVFLQPRKYLATVTALAASPFANDKGRIFNENIQALYPTIGTADELDPILSTAQLDTVFISLANEFDLQNHYTMKEKGEAAIVKAAVLLKADTKARKGDYGELKVKLWHQEKELAPRLANAFAEKLQQIHKDVQNQANIATLEGLEKAIARIYTELDSLDNALLPTVPGNDRGIRKNVLLHQLQQLESVANEYRVIVETNPAAIIIVERARTSDWPDKPKRILVIVITFVLSLFFSILLAVVMEKRKVTRIEP